MPSLRVLVLLLACTAVPAHAKRPYGAGKPLPASYLADVNATFASATEAYDTPPRLLQAWQPLFPLSRLMSGIEGQCTLAFGIDEGGATIDHAIVPDATGQVGDAKMCDHAIIAMRAWRFAPARKAGVPVAYPNRIQLSFAYRF